MTDPDILTRLRESDGGYFMRSMFTEAADEIDRKNLTIKALTEERDEVVRMANKLTAERDEARREICRLSQQAHNIACELSRYPKNAPSPQEYATALGWDCFKEGT